MVAYCSDRYAENRNKQFCIESQPALEAGVLSSAIALACLGLTEDKSGCMILYALKFM